MSANHNIINNAGSHHQLPTNPTGNETNVGDKSRTIVAFRPRILYCSLFVWNTVTVGKFIAPLLQKLSPKFTESIIGETLSLQYGIVAILAGWGGSLADRAERRSTHWGRGRLFVIATSTTLGTVAFLGHALPDYFGYNDERIHVVDANSSWDYLLLWHVLMRFVYAVSMAICAPALDGLALAHLDTMEGSTQAEFGKERMYGAVFWGLGSLASGFGIDRYGFGFLYFMAISSTAVSYLIIGVYIWGLERDTTGAFAKQVKSNNHAKSTYQTLDMNKEQPTEATTQDNVPIRELFMMLCKTGYGIAFCIFLFLLASGISVVDNLAFMFFALLGSTDSMNGLTVIFTVFMEIPCFHYAPELLKCYGPGKMLLIAGAAYVIRVFGYTIVPEGHMWMILILETLHGFTYACQKVGSVEYVARIMPKGYEASGQGILILVSYFGVVVGLFVAGWVQEALGPRVMYGFMGCVVLLGMLILIVAEKCSSDENVASNGTNSTERKNEQTRLLQNTSL